MGYHFWSGREGRRVAMRGRESCLPLGVPVRAGARGMEGLRLSSHRPFPTLGSCIWAPGVWDRAGALGPWWPVLAGEMAKLLAAGRRRGQCPFGDRGAVEQVQADQYIPEDDIHREVDTIERQLDALEHRGVLLEEKLRGGVNGAGAPGRAWQAGPRGGGSLSSWGEWELLRALASVGIWLPESREDDMLVDWFKLIHEKHLLVRRESELIYV